MSCGAHSPLYARKLGVVNYGTYQSCLFPVLSTWVGYWTTADEAIGPDPGIASTDIGGGVIVCDSWTDQRQGLVLPAIAMAQRPVFATDGEYFSGLKTIQCAVSGSKGLLGDFGVDLFASGSRPYIVVVTRNYTAPPGDSRIVEIGSSAATGNWRMGYRFVDPAGRVGVTFPSNAVEIASSLLDRTPYVHEAWNQAGVGGSVRKNGSEIATNATLTTGVSVACSRVTVGCGRLGTGQFANNSFAEILALTAYPGDAIALRLVGLMRQKWSI